MKPKLTDPDKIKPMEATFPEREPKLYMVDPLKVPIWSMVYGYSVRFIQSGLTYINKSWALAANYISEQFWPQANSTLNLEGLKMKKVWNWLNGNKTFFGLFILLILQQGWIAEHTLGFEILQWLGGLLSGVGVAHKLLKADTSPEPNK